MEKIFLAKKIDYSIQLSSTETPVVIVDIYTQLCNNYEYEQISKKKKNYTKIYKLKTKKTKSKKQNIKKKNITKHTSMILSCVLPTWTCLLHQLN